MKDYSLHALIILGLIVLAVNAAFSFATIDTQHITVTKLERIVETSNDSTSSKYLVFTEDEVFENTDTIFFLKFASSDLQGKLREGQTFKVKVNGWRVPFFSMYRNIIKIVDEEEKDARQAE